MKIIYDFDGTLTPYEIPQYKIIKQCGYDDAKLKEEMKKIMNDKNMTTYEAFYYTYEKILSENNIPKNKHNILLGCEEVKFNYGVIDFFENFATKENGITNYVVTAGIEDYVKNTRISGYIDGIYGVQYKIVDGIYDKISFMLDGKQKPNIIKKIIRECDNELIIYIGDGLTDEAAFEYVKSIGGYTIFVGSSEKDKENYLKLKEKGFVDQYCSRDYSENSEIRKYIMMINKNYI